MALPAFALRLSKGRRDQDGAEIAFTMISSIIRLHRGHYSRPEGIVQSRGSRVVDNEASCDAISVLVYPRIVYTDLDIPWVLRTFGDGVPKVFVIRAVMPYSHVLGYRSNNFFSSMA
jgi:hypothetical protein